MQNNLQMLKKGSILNSILTGSCPKCHEESMYLDQNPYNVRNVYKMHERCSHCGTKYDIEPSFFYGAMYVSYGLGIAFGVASFIICYFFIGEKSLITNFIAICVTLVVFMPLIMRWSRNIWINFFISYDEDWEQRKKIK